MKLEVYRRADGLYAWRLKAKNGRIIATDGGQGYEEPSEARRMAEVVTHASFRTQDIQVILGGTVDPSTPVDAPD